MQVLISARKTGVESPHFKEAAHLEGIVWGERHNTVLQLGH